MSGLDLSLKGELPTLFQAAAFDPSNVERIPAPEGISFGMDGQN